jgi:hypothetical protein
VVLLPFCEFLNLDVPKWFPIACILWDIWLRSCRTWAVRGGSDAYLSRYPIQRQQTILGGIAPLPSGFSSSHLLESVQKKGWWNKKVMQLQSSPSAPQVSSSPLPPHSTPSFPLPNSNQGICLLCTFLHPSLTSHENITINLLHPTFGPFYKSLTPSHRILTTNHI